MTAVVINLPQRFQVVNGNGPLEAGYRFLALTVVASVGAFFAGFLAQNLRIAPLWILLAGASLQIIGLALASTLSTGSEFQNITYLYQVILGLGFGTSWSCTIMAIPLVANKKDTAVGMGSIGQLRYLGRSIGIAICTNILNKHMSTRLSTILSPAQLGTLLQSTEFLSRLPPDLQDAARQAHAEGFNTQSAPWLALEELLSWSHCLCGKRIHEERESMKTPILPRNKAPFYRTIPKLRCIPFIGPQLVTDKHVHWRGKG